MPFPLLVGDLALALLASGDVSDPVTPTGSAGGGPEALSWLVGEHGHLMMHEVIAHKQCLAGFASGLLLGQACKASIVLWHRGRRSAGRRGKPAPADPPPMPLLEAYISANTPAGRRIQAWLQACIPADTLAGRQAQVKAAAWLLSRHGSDAVLCVITAVGLWRRRGVVAGVPRRLCGLPKHVCGLLSRRIAAGGGKGRGKGPPPPPAGKGTGKGLGKGKGVPKAKAAPVAAGGKGSSGRRNSAALTPFGQCIHLVQPAYSLPNSGTVFAELTSDTEKIDADLMTEMFSTDNSKTSVKRFTPKQSQGTCLFDGPRAQNLAINLSRLKVPTDEVCKCVEALDTSSTALTTEDIETVLMCLPSSDEVQKLTKHQDDINSLRDIEQRIWPLCRLTFARLQLMKIAKTHVATSESLLHRCRVLRSAAQEARNSSSLRDLLGAVLQIFNFINHGAVQSSEGTVFGFSIESLHVLAQFKKNGVSALHYLTLTMMAKNDNFSQELRASLKKIPEAGRERVANLKVDVSKFHAELLFIRTWLNAQDEEFAQREQVANLLHMLEREDTALNLELDKMTQLVFETQRYFSVTEDDKMPEPEQFFGHIGEFLMQFQSCWLEISCGRGRWSKLANVRSLSQGDSNCSSTPVTPRQPGTPRTPRTPRGDAGPMASITAQRAAAATAKFNNSKTPPPTTSQKTDTETAVPTPRVALETTMATMAKVLPELPLKVPLINMTPVCRKDRKHDSADPVMLKRLLTELGPDFLDPKPDGPPKRKPTCIQGKRLPEFHVMNDGDSDDSSDDTESSPGTSADSARRDADVEDQPLPLAARPRQTALDTAAAQFG
mmetsp:Transcript_182410/g.578089  ORF Transcript_182410/g.578089 Transcript_182410/m.578089 type:complete len:834 (-) Transcript_182410:275-2776(-)